MTGRPRDRLYRVEAIVLRRVDIGEADRLLTLLTAERGKLRVVAKGVRKPSSRKSGHVELLNTVDLQIARGHDLDIVNQADTLEAFGSLRTDLDRLGYAYYLAELLDRFSEEGVENRTLFDLGLQGLRELGQTDDPRRTMRYLELKILQVAGYRPQLFTCVQCGSELQAVNQFFSLEGGGALDPRCKDSFPDAEPLSLNALKVLRFFQTRDYAQTTQVKLGPAAQEEVERLLQRFITYHLERNLKSVGFIQTLRRGSAQSARIAAG